MRTGHLVERAEIAVALDLLFSSNTEWHTHGEMVQFCRDLSSYQVHEDCVRKVAREMVAYAKVECIVRNGNYLYRQPTALWKPKMVRRARVSR